MKKRNLREAYTREDGIYILYKSNYHADSYYVEVWENGKVVEKTDELHHGYTEGKASDAVWEMAVELQEKYPGLEIIDATGVIWSSFSDEYHKQPAEGGVTPFTQKGAKYHEYTDEELDAMDERPVQMVKWAMLTMPGVFKIYDNKQKNPNRLWDTQMFRGLGGYNKDTRHAEFVHEFEKRSADTYEGTWEDIKDSDFVLDIFGRFYESRKVKSLLTKLVNAGITIDGGVIDHEAIETGATVTDSWGDREPEVISFMYSFDALAIEDSKTNAREKELQMVIDVLAMLGVPFGTKLKISDELEKDKYGNKAGEYFVLSINPDTYKVRILKNTNYDKAATVKVGDVIHIAQSHYEIDSLDYNYVLKVFDDHRVEVADITTYKKTTSIWGSSDYNKRLSKEKYAAAKAGDLRRLSVKKVDLAKGRYSKVSPEDIEKYGI